MRNPFQPLLLGSFLLLLPPTAEDGATPQTGTFGQIAPQSGDVRLVDAVAHQDDHGGTLQQLVCAAGSKAGFSLLWSDHREGMTGLYLGRFDHEGHIREPERPIHQPYAGRRLQPGLSMDADGDGIALWTCDYLNVPVLYARSYEGSGNWRATDQALTEVPEQMHEASERQRGVQLPSAAPIEGGGFAVAWTIRGALMWAEVKRDGSRRAEPQRLNPRDQQADAGVQLCGPGGKKDPLAIWHANERLWSLSLGAPKAAAHDLGAGTLVRSVATEDGGAWILVHGDKGTSVRRLRAEGKPEGEAITVCDTTEQALDVAVLGSKLAVLVQSEGAKPAEAPARGRGGRTQVAAAGARFELRLIEAGKPAGAGIEFLSDKAKLVGTPLVASDGARLLVAWTDSREGDPDVFGRLVTPGGEPALGPEFRANTDRASADQTTYRLDANGSAGVVTWIDKRDGAPRAYARRIAAPGSFAGDEFALTAADPKLAPGGVAPALRPDGTCAFLWADSSGALRLALQDPSGTMIGEPRVLETEGAREATITTLPADTGWLCAWIGPEPAVWALRVDLKGEPAGKKQRLSESPGKLGNLVCCALGGRRLVLAWDADDAGWKIHGRCAGLEGNPLGAEFDLEPSPRHQDWDPALAPVGNGGFVAAWTSGAPDDGSRDVVARFFDGQGSPAGPLLWISPTHNEQDNADVTRLADGTWAVVWEDDISGLDNTYVRRIQKDQRQVGPIVRINELATKSIQDRCAPRVAALTDGLLFAFGDRARSLGWDVRVRIVGPKFDVLEKH